MQKKQRTVKSDERKAWEREQRMNRIVDIVEKLFFSRGYEGTTVDDIARAAGYTKRSIYIYFRDREDLFLAVVRRGQVLFKAALEEAVAGPVPDDQPLSIGLGRAFYQFSLDHPGHLALLMTYESKLYRYASDQPAEDDGGFRSQCQALSREYGGIVTRVIERDIERGLIRSKLDARQLMLLLWGQVIGVMQVILMRKESFREVYGITPEMLFEEFLAMTRRSLG